MNLAHVQPYTWICCHVKEATEFIKTSMSFALKQTVRCRAGNQIGAVVSQPSGGSRAFPGPGMCLTRQRTSKNKSEAHNCKLHKPFLFLMKDWSKRECSYWLICMNIFEHVSSDRRLVRWWKRCCSSNENAKQPPEKGDRITRKKSETLKHILISVENTHRSGIIYSNFKIWQLSLSI